jgi:hypothetical protein
LARESDEALARAVEEFERWLAGCEQSEGPPVVRGPCSATSYFFQ